MPPPPRAKAALQAMKNIGFSSKMVAPLLRTLLDVYDNNWEYIEENGYQVLIDNILEQQDSKVTSVDKQDAVTADDPQHSPQHSRKRLREMGDNPSSQVLGSDCSGEPLLKIPKLEADVSPVAPDTEPFSPHLDNRRETRASYRLRRSSGSQDSAEQTSILTNRRGKRPVGEGSNNILLKEPKTEPDIEVHKTTNNEADPPNVVAPIPGESEAHRSEQSRGDFSPTEISNLQANADKRKGKANIILQNEKEFEHVDSPGASSTLDIISSDTGEVKLMLSFKSCRPDIRKVGVDFFLEKFEDRCLKSYKILQPGSVMNIMKEMCEFASEWTAEASN